MKILIVVLLFAIYSRAEHWNPYCQGNEKAKLIQFDPVYQEENGQKYLQESYDQFHSLEPNRDDEVTANKGGSYYNLCTGPWSGRGSPSWECVGYCMSALNLMTAIKTDLQKYDKTTVEPFKTACAIPTGDTTGMVYSREVNPQCSACNVRAYNKKVQNQMEICLVAYKAYTTKIFGGNTGSGGHH